MPRKRNGHWHTDFGYFDPITGQRKRHRKKLEGVKTRREAVEVEAALRRSLWEQEQGLKPSDANPLGLTVFEVVDQWIEEAEMKEASRARLRSVLDVHFGEWEAADIKIDQLKPIVISDWLREKAESYRPATPHRLRVTLMSAIRYAQERELYHGENPVKRVPAVKLGKPNNTTTLSAEEVRTILEHAEPWIRDVIGFAVFTMARAGEVGGALKDSFDLEAGTFRFHRHYSQEGTKMGGDVTLPLAPAALPYVKSAIGRSTVDRAFTTKAGAIITENVRLAEFARKAAAEAGVHKHFTFHDLRRTGITLAVEAGLSPAAVNKLARHSTMEMTMAYFKDHLSKDWLAKEQAKLGVFGHQPVTDNSDTENNDGGSSGNSEG